MNPKEKKKFFTHSSIQGLKNFRIFRIFENRQTKERKSIFSQNIHHNFFPSKKI